jgi:hypothetical protein
MSDDLNMDFDDFYMQLMSRGMMNLNSFGMNGANPINIFGGVNPSYSVSKGFNPPGASQGYQANQLENMIGLLLNPQMYEMLFGGSGVDPALYDPQIDESQMVLEDEPEMKTIRRWSNAKGPDGKPSSMAGVVAAIEQGYDPETAIRMFIDTFQELKDDRGRQINLESPEMKGMIEQARKVAYDAFDEFDEVQAVRKRNEQNQSDWAAGNVPTKPSEASERLRSAGFRHTPNTQWSPNMIDPSLDMLEEIKAFAKQQSQDKRASSTEAWKLAQNSGSNGASGRNAGKHYRQMHYKSERSKSNDAYKDYLQASRDHLNADNKAKRQQQWFVNRGISPFDQELMQRAMKLTQAGFGS